MKFRIRREVLEDFFKGIAALDNECMLYISSAGFRVIMKDKGNVAMIETKITDLGFYYISEENDGPLPEPEFAYKYGIDVTKALLFIKNLGADVELDVPKPDEKRNKIRFGSGKEGFDLMLLAVETIPKHPEEIPTVFEYTATISLSGEVFNRTMKRAKILADKVWLKAFPDEHRFNFFAKGDLDDYDKDLEDEEILELTGSESIALYSLDYISSMSLILYAADKVTINFRSDAPLLMKSDQDEYGLSVAYVLAPRIENDY